MFGPPMWKNGSCRAALWLAVGAEVESGVLDEGVPKPRGEVLLTAKGQEVDRKKGLELGAYDYMTKPFDPDELVELARELLRVVD